MKPWLYIRSKIQKVCYMKDYSNMKHRVWLFELRVEIYSSATIESRPVSIIWKMYKYT